MCSHSKAKHVVHTRKPLETLLVLPSRECRDPRAKHIHTLRIRIQRIMQVDCDAVSHFALNHSIWNVGIHLNTPYCLPLAGHYCCFISHIHTTYKRCIRHTPWCVVSLDFLLLHTLWRREWERWPVPAPNVLAKRLLYVFMIWGRITQCDNWMATTQRHSSGQSEIYSPVPILYGGVVHINTKRRRLPCARFEAINRRSPRS